MEIEVEKLNLEDKIHGELECLAKPDGSSRFSISMGYFCFIKIFHLMFEFKIKLDDTIQLCAVYGPGEVKIMKELADRAFVNVTYKPRVGNASNLIFS